ncbi:trafficking protein particle complex subunit 8 isoform X2 [Anabrus simplex]|uniref:trafficking protein particle complex subunit 8 isoform X2 n=1 Tax=Anabrus simplex TaxID=316456 RepID=UPI0034DD4B80
MAQCKLTPHEFIQNAFSPLVAVMCSPLVDQICQKNNLSFTEMIQPFCKLNTEAHFRDPSGNVITVRNLRVTVQDVHFRPPQPTLARKYLNESVSLSASDRNSSLQIGNDIIEVPASVPWFEAWRETFLQVQFPSDHEFTKHYLCCMLVVSSAESSPADTLVLMSQQLQQLQTIAPAKLPKWFCANVLRYYVLLHDALDGNSEKAETVFDAIKNTYGISNCFFLQMNSRPPGNIEDQSHLPDPWSQFLTRQLDGQDASDHDSSPRTPAEMGGVTVMPSRITFDGGLDSGSGTGETHNLEVGQEAGETVASTGAVTVTRHPLSPETDEDAHHSFIAGTDKVQNTANDIASVPNHINTNVWAGHTAQAGVAAHGACLTTSDLDRLRGLVQDFCVKALLPYVERQIQQLSDLVSNKKGVSRSLLSATKRWFGTNKPGLPSMSSPANAVVYGSDAPELQLRRLGDLCFMFGHYALAFQIYHTAKRDFNADQAWLYYAGALEMAALSAFMQGESTRKAQEYMEESIVTYLNSCKMPQFATRATLLSTECLKGRGMYGEAAQQFIRMTSEDSDLRSALLLEQASYCFLKASRPRMARKYAFHIVLAGHRFAKAGQRQHSMRCYRQAYQVYEKKCWSLAEDHIHLTTGHQAANLKQLTESAKAFAHLLTPMSRQTGAQQAVYLRDFLAIQQQLSSDEGDDLSSSLPVLPLPLVDQDSVKVLVGPLPPFAPPLPLPQEGPGLVPATGVTFEDDLPDSTRWSKLEEALVIDAQGSLPMIFRPTVQMFSNRTNNTNNPISVVGEPVSVQMRLCNPLRTALPLQQLQLLWNLELQPGKVIEPRSAQAHAQCLDTLLLPPDSTQDVVLSIVPQCVGTLHILGVSYRLVSPLPEPGPLASPSVEHGTLSVTGKQVFTPRSVKQVRGGKESVVDKRLQIVITPSAPCLQVNFRGLNSEMLCGELQQVTVEFCNVGNAALTGLRVATSTPALFVLHGPTSNYGGCRVSTIPLKKPLEPGHMHSVPLWLRAPDTPGSATLDMLVYYENVSTSSVPRYRVVRHSWQLSLVPGVQLLGTAQNTRSSKSSGEQRALNMVFQVKNCNQVYDPVMTEVSLVQVSAASSLWRLAEILAMPKEVRLQSQEMVHLVLKACKQHGENKDETQFSDLPLDDSSMLESVRANPFVDFFNCFLDSRNISGEIPDNSIESHGAKEALTASLLDITVILRWQACVMAGQGKKRIALGQHHLRIEGVGKPSVWPPDLTQAATAALHTQPDGPLRIFGPEAVSSQSSSSVVPYPSLDILQKLVTYSIQHPSQIAHNFKQSRLCVVPVQMQLQNCSGQQLLVKIKTLGSNRLLHIQQQNYKEGTSAPTQYLLTRLVPRKCKSSNILNYMNLQDKQYASLNILECLVQTCL